MNAKTMGGKRMGRLPILANTLVYRIIEGHIEILQCGEHYED